MYWLAGVLIVAALARSGGVQKDAAALLGLSFRSLRYLVAKLQVRVRERRLVAVRVPESVTSP